MIYFYFAYIAFESVTDLVQHYRSKQIEMRCPNNTKNTKKTLSSLSISQMFCVSFEFPVNNSQYCLVTVAYNYVILYPTEPMDQRILLYCISLIAWVKSKILYRQ